MGITPFDVTAGKIFRIMEHLEAKDTERPLAWSFLEMQLKPLLMLVKTGDHVIDLDIMRKRIKFNLNGTPVRFSSKQAEDKILGRLYGKQWLMSTERHRFSERERQIIRLICLQQTNRQMAITLGKSMRTIENNRMKLLKKIGAKNAAGLVMYAIAHNFLKMAQVPA